MQGQSTVRKGASEPFPNSSSLCRTVQSEVGHEDGVYWGLKFGGQVMVQQKRGAIVYRASMGGIRGSRGLARTRSARRSSARVSLNGVNVPVAKRHRNDGLSPYRGSQPLKGRRKVRHVIKGFSGNRFRNGFGLRPITPEHNDARVMVFHR